LLKANKNGKKERMSETPKLETPSCASTPILATTNKFQKYDQSEKGRARCARRNAKRKAQREARRITRQIKRAAKTSGVSYPTLPLTGVGPLLRDGSFLSTVKVIPLPESAPVKTANWERIRDIGEGMLILPDPKLPYRAGLTFDPWDVQRVEAQLGDLRFSTLYMGDALDTRQNLRSRSEIFW
jgi:hypothetical protein